MSESELLVIGHRNPDTDAICSAIAYAEYKRRTGFPHAEAARCGDTNERIDFVLRSFGVAAPKFVPDVAPKVRDVMQGNVVSVTSETTVVEALSVMDAKGIRVLPILNSKHICEGLVSVFKMSKFFCPTTDRVFDSRRVLASVSNIVRTLDAQVVVSSNPEHEEDLILMVGAMTAESFAKRLPKYPPEKLVVIVGDRWEIQREAIRGRVRVVIVTGGLPVEESILEEAKKFGVNLLISPHDTATTAMLVRSAISVKHMMHEHFLTFRVDEPLAEIQNVAAASHFQAFPVLDEKGRTVGILSKSDFLKKVDRQLILVDHNELSQAVQGADQVEILEIIDHHRIGSLSRRASPFSSGTNPWARRARSWQIVFSAAHIELPKPIAGLLLAGLVSDTLNLTSPTTTERDAEILKRLEDIAGVQADRVHGEAICFRVGIDFPTGHAKR